MNKKTKILFKISCLLLFIGLSLLIFLSSSLEPEIIKISEINKKRLDEYVKIRGEVSELKIINTNTGKITIFKISDETGKITVLFYKEINLSKEVEVLGKVDYKENLQIHAKKIKNL